MKYILVVLFLFLTSCRYDLVDTTLYKIFPKDNMAYKATITNNCPLDASEPEEVPLENLSGYICVSESDFADFRREHQKQNCK